MLLEDGKFQKNKDWNRKVIGHLKVPKKNIDKERKRRK